MLEAFAGSVIDLNTFGGFMATEYLGLIWVLIAGAAAIAFACKSLSSEVGAGTMEVVLAQPVPRRTLVFVRWLAMAVYLAALVLATTVPIYLTALWQDVAVDAGNLVLLSGAQFVLALAIGGLAFAFASVSSESAKPASMVGGLLGVMWVLSFLAGNMKWAEALNPVNLFHYWNAASILNSGTVPSGMWVVYGILALGGLAFALFAFGRRDVA
jgi:ABC-2 type transport system permease protein